MRCFVETWSERGTVMGIYTDLRWTLWARPSEFEKADIAFIQKDYYKDWCERRKKAGSQVSLNQLPHVTKWIVDKANLARLIAGQDYCPDTFIDKSEGQLQGIWVQKPSDGGRGLDINFLRDPSDWGKPGYVLQRYLDTPYLIDGRKFDIRVMAKVDDKGRLHLHREGLIRCASLPFDEESLDPLIHNSNCGFQKRMGKRQKSFTLLSKTEFADEAIPQIDTILNDVWRLLREQDVFQGSNDFELLGIDFLVDESKKVWLLEINDYPGWHSFRSSMGRFYLASLGSLFK